MKKLILISLLLVVVVKSYAQSNEEMMAKRVIIGILERTPKKNLEVYIDSFFEKKMADTVFTANHPVFGKIQITVLVQGGLYLGSEDLRDPSYYDYVSCHAQGEDRYFKFVDSNGDGICDISYNCSKEDYPGFLAFVIQRLNL